LPLAQTIFGSFLYRAPKNAPKLKSFAAPFRLSNGSRAPVSAGANINVMPRSRAKRTMVSIRAQYTGFGVDRSLDVPVPDVNGKIPSYVLKSLGPPM